MVYCDFFPHKEPGYLIAIIHVTWINETLSTVFSFFVHKAEDAHSIKSGGFTGFVHWCVLSIFFLIAADIQYFISFRCTAPRILSSNWFVVSIYCICARINTWVSKVSEFTRWILPLDVIHFGLKKRLGICFSLSLPSTHSVFILLVILMYTLS